MLFRLFVGFIFALNNSKGFFLDYFGRLSDLENKKLNRAIQRGSTSNNQLTVVLPSQLSQPLVPLVTDFHALPENTMKELNPEPVVVVRTTVPMPAHPTKNMEVINKEKCNHYKLRRIMKKSITRDRVESKRQIASAARGLFKSPLDVVCSNGDLSYLVWTGFFCEVQLGPVSCLAYTQ